MILLLISGIFNVGGIRGTNLEDFPKPPTRPSLSLVYIPPEVREKLTMTFLTFHVFSSSPTLHVHWFPYLSYICIAFFPYLSYIFIAFITFHISPLLSFHLISPFLCLLFIYIHRVSYLKYKFIAFLTFHISIVFYLSHFYFVIQFIFSSISLPFIYSLLSLHCVPYL